MPAYKHQFTNIADIETAYAEAITIKKVFNTPYDQDGMPKLGTWEEAKKAALAEAQEIANSMRNEKVKQAVANGEVPEIVALIAYLNSLK